MISFISKIFKRTAIFVENDLKEVIIHTFETIFYGEHIVINMNYVPINKFHPRNINNV